MKTQHSIFVLTFLLLWSCSTSTSKDELEAGESITEERKISGITQVKISGVVNLYLSQGNEESIRIEGVENVVSLIEITEKGEVLEIGYNDEEDLKSFFNDFTPDIYLQVSDLSKLSFDGVGKIQTTNSFKVKELTIIGEGIGKLDLEVEAEVIKATFNMMGNIVLRGAVEKISLTNEGIGKIEASNLISQNMILNSSGIGKIDVHCENELSITVNGIGSVDYSGNPKVIKKEVNGIGKVTEN